MPETTTATFKPATEYCPVHGSYPLNAIDEHGTVRWFPGGCQSCRRQAVSDGLMRRAAILPRFKDSAFGNYEAQTPVQQATLDTCRRYAAEFPALQEKGTCLILRGNPGTGKNHLAVAIARVLLEGGFTVLNVKAYELIQRIRETWKPDSTETEGEVYAAFAAVDLLIIDEVGRQYKSRDGDDNIELFNVIDRRYSYGNKPVVIISNRDKAGIRKALGEAAYDRLRQGGTKIANFDWESRRGDL